jgi:hypothetical protein
MHDILEGVLQYEVKKMLKVFIKVERYFTLDILSDSISKYDFGYYNDKNKPTLITEAKFASKDNSLRQNGMCETRIPAMLYILKTYWLNQAPS